MKRRILSIILTLAMCLSMLPATALAAEYAGWEAAITGGNGTTVETRSDIELPGFDTASSDSDTIDSAEDLDNVESGWFWDYDKSELYLKTVAVGGDITLPTTVKEFDGQIPIVTYHLIGDSVITGGIYWGGGQANAKYIFTTTENDKGTLHVCGTVHFSSGNDKELIVQNGVKMTVDGSIEWGPSGSVSGHTIVDGAGSELTMTHGLRTTYVTAKNGGKLNVKNGL